MINTRYFVVIFIGLSILLLGCDVMRHSNKVTFVFAVDPNVDLSGLRVNIHLSGYETGWYSYEKTMTVIDAGKVLEKKFKEEYEPFYTIKAIDTVRGHQFIFENAIDDSRRTDYKVSFLFSDKQVVRYNTEYKSRFEKGSIYRTLYKYVPLATETKALTFLDPKSSVYQSNTIYSQEDLKMFEDLSFEDLKKTSKLKEQDILRLQHLTDEQKQELIKVHSRKDFF